MTTKLESLSVCLQNALGDAIVQTIDRLGELTLVVKPEAYAAAMRTLRDHPDCRFEQLIDLCGMDYSAYGDGAGFDQGGEGARFAVVYICCRCPTISGCGCACSAADDDLPVVASVIEIWPSANWFEREAFDLYGIIFDGHPDLRRILTDYGFIGHPFRKDFPLSGNVEMRYDPTSSA